MRSIQNLTTILGSLALAWTLVLASPGVRIVKADEGAAQSEADEIADGGSCAAGSVSDGHAVVDVLHQVQRAKIKQLAASLKNHDPGPDYVELDNRGFNQPRGE